MHLQAKLLSVLEQRQVTPVGSDRAFPFDVRIIAATNVPAAQLRDESTFRTDLLFRLNMVEIVVLPLARHFLAQYAHKYGDKTRSFSKATEKALLEYDWPGNVRALRHAIERAVILADSGNLEPADLQLDYAQGEAQASTTVMPTILNLDHLEKETILKALRKHGFNISRAASELGLTRASLYRRMEKHDI